MRNHIEIDEHADNELAVHHRFSTRLWHWVNAVALLVLLMSGLMIFNAHPRLYWGEYGANPDHSWLQIGAQGNQGFLRVGDQVFDTTGVLGLWQDGNGRAHNRAFPGWITIPSNYNLAKARNWHFTFAWIFAIGLSFYALVSLVNGHTRHKLLPTLKELSPAHIWQDIKDHARLKFPKGRAALKYNILQKLTYIGVLGVLLPLMILTGLTMSPQVSASWGWLIDLFGGRQSARSIHFIAAGLLVTFFVVHMVMILVSGPANQVRAMITGKLRISKEEN